MTKNKIDYIFDSNKSLICACIDGEYVSVKTGEVFDDVDIEFINKKLSEKKFKKSDCEIELYDIYVKDKLIGYRFVIDGFSTWHNLNFSLMDEGLIRQINGKKSKKEILRWGDNGED